MRRLDLLLQRMEKVAASMEKAQFDEFLTYRTEPKKIIKTGLLVGIARGLGGAIGFTILGALLMMLLKNIAVSNLPVLSRLIADLVRMVENNLTR
jgi:hypothetical protein